MNSASRQGFFYGLAAYGLWGLLPLYFKALADVAPLEILAHRIVWSCLLLVLLAWALGKLGALRDVMRSGRATLTLVVTTLLIALNWFTYIYAVSTNQVLESSLGYFITPLVNVLLGVAFLKERLRGVQLVALALAAAGVLNLARTGEGFPWIALTLAISFAFYGLLRKTVAADGLTALLFETIALAPIAVIYLIVLARTTQSAFADSPRHAALLAASGAITAVPLLCFAGAARRLQLSTLGILQYLAPSLQFALAVLAFREPFSLTQLASFCLIWAAVAIYSLSSLSSYRAQLAAVSVEV